MSGRQAGGSSRPAPAAAAAPAASDEASDALEALHAAAQCTICYSLLDTPLLLKECGHSCEFGALCWRASWPARLFRATASFQ